MLSKRSTALELTYNWDVAAYDHGAAFGHIALEVDDVAKTCARFAEMGTKIARAAGPMTHSSPNRASAEIIAFVDDPDGYRIELTERSLGCDLN